MRILHLTDSLGAGGAERNLLTVLRHGPRDVEHHIAHWEGDLLVKEFAELGRVHRLEAGRRQLLPVHLFDRVRRLLREVRPDVVHTQLLNATFLGRLASLGANATVVTTLQSAFYDGEDFGRATVVRRPLLQLVDRVTARRNAGLVAVSQYVKEHFVSRIGFDARRIEVIPNCLDPARAAAPDPGTIAAARASLGVAPGEKLLVHVGRLMSEKGQEEAIRAMPAIVERWPGARLALVGPGPERQRLEALIAELRLGRSVVLAGQRADVPAILHAADLFVFPSRREGLSVALVEALAAGLPAVTCDIPQNREVGDGFASVRFVAPRAPAQISAAAIALLSDPDISSSAAAAATVVRDRFSPERLAPMFFDACARWHDESRRR